MLDDALYAPKQKAGCRPQSLDLSGRFLGALSAIVIAKLPGGAVNQLGFRSQDGEILSQDLLVRDVVRPDELLQAYYIPTVVTRATRVSWKHTSTLKKVDCDAIGRC